MSAADIVYIIAEALILFMALAFLGLFIRATWMDWRNQETAFKAQKNKHYGCE